jgi:hypothetical protein
MWVEVLGCCAQTIAIPIAPAIMLVFIFPVLCVHKHLARTVRSGGRGDSPARRIFVQMESIRYPRQGDRPQRLASPRSIPREVDNAVPSLW